MRNGRGHGTTWGWGQGWVKGRGCGRKQPLDKSADKLDKDLESIMPKPYRLSKYFLC